MKLEGTKVLVTGGAGGMGRILVETLLQRDARVAVFDLNKEALGRLEDGFPEVFCREVDLTEPVAVAEAVAALVSELGPVDVLVNNAGLISSAALFRMTSGGLELHPLDEWDRVIRANLHSVFYTTREVAAAMIRKRVKGLIVNVSSVSSSGNAGQSAYSAAKAGVDALTKTWAKELGPLGIRVAGLAPGFFDTAATRAGLSEQILSQIRQSVPLGRLGEPAEIAQAVLAIIENDFFHGKVLALDGGLVL